MLTFKYQLPDHGDSVPLVLPENLPFHFFLEDEGQDETLGMYLDTVSILVGDGTPTPTHTRTRTLRRVVRYPILDPMCTSEGFVAHESVPVASVAPVAHDNMPVAPPHTPPSSSPQVETPMLRHGVLEEGGCEGGGRLMTTIARSRAMDSRIMGVPSTISEVLADAVGEDVGSQGCADVEPTDSTARLWSWLRFQWFSLLWNRDHSDAVACKGSIEGEEGGSGKRGEDKDQQERGEKGEEKDTAHEHASKFGAFGEFSHSGGLEMPQFQMLEWPGWPHRVSTSNALNTQVWLIDVAFITPGESDAAKEREREETRQKAYEREGETMK